MTPKKRKRSDWGGDLPEILDSCQACGGCPISLLDEEQLDRLETIGRIFHRSEGNIIFEEGDTAMECFFVCRRGTVEQFKRMKQGVGLVLGTARPGDVFGLSDILSEQRSYSVSARVLEEATLIGVPREEMLYLLQNSQRFSVEVLRKMGDYCRRLKLKLCHLNEKPLAERLATQLMELARLYGEEHGTAIEITLPLTNRELAEMIGSTPESVSTILRELKQESILHREGRRFFIHKPEELAARYS